MANSIEIFQNSLLKLIVRQGSDSDRKTVILTSGELGWTTDTKRLYVGDGTTLGGILVGNVFKGSATNVTTLAPASIGDLAFDSDNNNLYRLQSGDGSSIGNWQLIAGTYSAGNGSIVIGSDNKITVGSLSSGNISPNLLETPLFLNGSNKIALSANLAVDTIRPKNATALTLFPALSVNGVLYNFPSIGPSSGQTIISDGSGNLAWGSITLSSFSSNTITVVSPLTASVNGVNVTGTAVNPLTGSLVIGLSPTLSTTDLWARYSSSANTIINNKGIPTVNRTSQGHYTFTFAGTLPTSNPYAEAHIIGADTKFYIARVTGVTATFMTVQVYSLANPFLFEDADLAVNVKV